MIATSLQNLWVRTLRLSLYLFLHIINDTQLIPDTPSLLSLIYISCAMLAQITLHIISNDIPFN